MSTKLFLFAAFIISMLLMSVNNRKKRKRIVFFGDSITEQGMRPGGYIKRLQRELERAGIQDKYELVGAGISGNKVTDLQQRLHSDILYNGAEIVVVMIGINDVWHKGKPSRTGTDLWTFAAAYKEIVDALLAAEIKVLLCTPTLIGEDLMPRGHENLDLEQYCEVPRALANDLQLPLVDLRKAFIDYNLLNNSDNAAQGILTIDTVHLNDAGNQLVADEIWLAVQQLCGD